MPTIILFTFTLNPSILEINNLINYLIKIIILLLLNLNIKGGPIIS